MKTHIYYPGMEVRDELWLKFALLYLERLAFVFTVSEKSGLTTLLETLRRQTDLLAEPPAPAFFAAITPQIENQIVGLVAPDFVRHKVFGNKELIGRWRTPANHDCFCPAHRGWSGCTAFVWLTVLPAWRRAGSGWRAALPT